MRFYGLSFRDLMDLPLRVFWLMNGNIHRIRAEEDLRAFGLGSAAAVSAQPGSQQAVKDFRDALVLEIGTVVVVEEKLDRKALSEIRNLGGAL